MILNIITDSHILISFIFSACWLLIKEVLLKKFSENSKSTLNFKATQVRHSLSLLHSVLIVSFCVYFLNRNDVLLDLMAPTTVEQQSCLIFSLGYFIYDTLTWRFTDLTSIIMLFHHIFTVFPLMYVITKRHFGLLTILTLLILESTNPLLHTWRLLFINPSTASSNLHSIIGLLFAIAYTIQRLLHGTKFVQYLHNVNAPYFVIITANLLYVISFLFFIKIVTFLIKKIWHSLCSV